MCILRMLEDTFSLSTAQVINIKLIVVYVLKLQVGLSLNYRKYVAGPMPKQHYQNIQDQSV